MKRILFYLFLLLFCGCGKTGNVILDRPNIVLIYTDDQGYADLGCYGADDLATPHIDRLAEEGIRLTQFYVAQPVCTASRAALLTGCYPNRLGMHGALMPYAGKGIHEDEWTMAEMLSEAGYRCGVYGKWHLGHEDQFNPLNHGFDDYLGIPYSNDMWPLHPWQDSIFDFPPLPLYDGMKVVDTLVDQTTLTARLTHRAIRYMEENSDRPFFIYLAHPQPHVPLFSGSDFQGRSERGLYGDVIAEIDWSTGLIMDKLEELGISSNTWIIYASDNGPWLSYGTHSGKAGDLREGKGTVWEGGIRVPCIMRFPGALPKGKTISSPVMNIDLLPTIAEKIGQALPDRTIDGKNVWKIITGASTESPHIAYFFYYHTNELQAVRKGKFKLIFPHRYRTLEARPGGRDGLPVPYTYHVVEKPQLYDLDQDEGEETDLSSEYPEIVHEMTELAQSMREELGDALVQQEGLENRLPGKVK